MHARKIITSISRREKEITINAVHTIEHIILHFPQSEHKSTLSHIMSHTKYSKRTVLRCLATLCAQKVIMKEKQSSERGVHLATQYCHTKHLSQCQEREKASQEKYNDTPLEIKETTERTSLCQKNNSLAYARMRGKGNYNNIYNITQSTLLDNTYRAHEGQSFGTGAETYISTRNRKGRIMLWDKGRIMFYELFFSFFDATNGIVKCDLDESTGHTEYGIRATLCADLELLTRRKFREYFNSRELKLSTFKDRLLALAAYLRSGKAFQARGGISLQKLVGQGNLFFQLMDESISYLPAVEVKNQTTYPHENSSVQTEKSESYSAEEVRNATILLYEKLGRDPSVMLQNLGVA